MAVAVAFTDVWSDGRRIHAIGTLIFSGNYVNNGDAVDIKGAKGAIDHQKWLSRLDPTYVEINGKAGYFYEYDKVNKKIIVRQGDNTNAAAAPFIQLAAAAYPAGVTGDTVTFYAIGKKV